MVSPEEWALLPRLDSSQRSLAVKFLIDEFVSAQVSETTDGDLGGLCVRVRSCENEPLREEVLWLRLLHSDVVSLCGS